MSEFLKVRYPLITKSDTDPFTVADNTRITNSSAVLRIVKDIMAKRFQVAALFFLRFIDSEPHVWFHHCLGYLGTDGSISV